MKKYTLTKKDTGHKSGRFVYTVTDETGAVISTRKSDREYAACTADGSFYFGRLDLIGGGDHGKQIKFAQGWGRDAKNKMVPNMHEPDATRLESLNAIAYLAAETSAPVQEQPTEKPTMTVDELAYRAWIGEKKAQLAQWKAGSANGTIKDDENPAFMLSGVQTSLLAMIAKGEISAQFLACQELANRGLDLDGKWIGFAAAEKLHFGTK
jgi:hypothetical protein